MPLPPSPALFSRPSGAGKSVVGEGTRCHAASHDLPRSVSPHLLFTTLHEATLQPAPTEVTVGCEATGPYWLSLYEALIAQGYRVLVLNPFYVKARRGTTPRGTKTDPVDARQSAELL